MDRHEFGSIAAYQTKRAALSGTFTPEETGTFTLEIYNYRNNLVNTIRNYIDHISLVPQEFSLSASTDLIRGITGGSATLSFSAGQDLANCNYIVLGGSHGGVPGTSLGWWFLPLNLDDHFYLMLHSTNTSFFKEFEGLLDGEGNCTAVFDTCGPVDENLLVAGKTLTFVIMVMSGPREFPLLHISNPVEVSFF